MQREACLALLWAVLAVVAVPGDGQKRQGKLQFPIEPLSRVPVPTTLAQLSSQLSTKNSLGARVCAGSVQCAHTEWILIFIDHGGARSSRVRSAGRLGRRIESVPAARVAGLFGRDETRRARRG